MVKVKTCARLLAYVTGLVNHELLLQNQYLAAENRILRLQSFSENRSACLQDGINGGEVIRSTSVRRDRVAA